MDFGAAPRPSRVRRPAYPAVSHGTARNAPGMRVLPAKRMFPVVYAGRTRDPTSRLDKAEVTGSSPVSPTAETPLSIGGFAVSGAAVLLRGYFEPTPRWRPDGALTVY